MNFKYAIVTPVKDEEKYFPKTIASVLKQTVKPQIWIIIDDHSRDRTGQIIENVSEKFEWVVGCKGDVKDHNRKPGGEALINQGICRLNLLQYDYFVRMDGDISFDHDYFEKIFKKFEQNESLGIASGVCYFPAKNKLIEEKHPRFHTRGPLKTYRMECFSAIGGLESCLGWDTVDEIKANMQGWITRSFMELKIIHYRKTQTASGALNGMNNLGKASYYLGYHPIFFMLRAIKNMTSPPYIFGGMQMLNGFLRGYIKRQPQIADGKFIKYLRKQQMNKLLKKDSIWK